MQNDKGQSVDLYIPRKWCVTERGEQVTLPFFEGGNDARSVRARRPGAAPRVSTRTDGSGAANRAPVRGAGAGGYATRLRTVVDTAVPTDNNSTMPSGARFRRRSLRPRPTLLLLRRARVHQAGGDARADHALQRRGAERLRCRGGGPPPPPPPLLPSCPPVLVPPSVDAWRTLTRTTTAAFHLPGVTPVLVASLWEGAAAHESVEEGGAAVLGPRPTPHVVRRAPPPSFRCCSTTLYGRSWLCGELPLSHLLPLFPLPLPPFTRSSWTKRLITADDYAAVQINLGDVDAATGRYMGTFKTFAISGYLRDKGESDMALTELFTKLNNKH
jgi:small subunit ribosomal protein S21e